MQSLIVFLALVTSSAQAKVFTCYVNNPCQHQSKLNGCVAKEFEYTHNLSVGSIPVLLPGQTAPITGTMYVDILGSIFTSMDKSLVLELRGNADVQDLLITYQAVKITGVCYLKSNR